MSRAVTCQACFLKYDAGTTKHIFPVRRNLNKQRADNYWFAVSGDSGNAI